MSDVGVATKGSELSADVRIARTVAGGNQEAFVALMRRFNGMLYRTARSIVTDDLAAESVVERAWLLAYSTMDKFTGATTLPIWLMRIVIGEALLSLPKQVHAGVISDQQRVQSRRLKRRSGRMHPT